ncbi:hypothetical protein Golob_024975, partial [Gossypium lobatum]|nr:hypothetical protein [Gossypium lobatum]
MAEMLNSMDFGLEDKKSSTSSIKIADLANHTTSICIKRENWLGKHYKKHKIVKRFFKHRGELTFQPKK